jgi:hypothetical protein
VNWIYGSLYDSVDKFATAFGFDNAAVAITLAMVPWDSPEDRDAFIEGVSGNLLKQTGGN